MCRVFPLPASFSSPPPLFLLCSAGTEKRFELTPVAAISVHLLASDGTELQVNRPITVSIPLPAESDLKENDEIRAWRFDPQLGTYRNIPQGPPLLLILNFRSLYRNRGSVNSAQKPLVGLRDPLDLDSCFKSR